MKILRFVLIAALGASLHACRRQAQPEPPLARPAMTLARDRTPIGSPVDVTYRFDVDPAAPTITENFKVFVGFVDSDEQLMWTDDHDPVIPTSQWKPGQKIEYTRTVFIPVYPYVGNAAVHMGLYSPSTQKRVSLSGDDTGQRAYRVAKFEVLPQSESIFIVRKDGWHGPETPPGNARVEWQWTKKNEATLAFKNPKRDSVFYLDVDSPGHGFPQGQHVQVKLGQAVVDDFVLGPLQQVLHKIPLAAAQLGAEDMVELKIVADKTFVPALVPGSNSKDGRELGLRVFHVYVEPRN
jgi:hypothetical protein